MNKVYWALLAAVLTVSVSVRAEMEIVDTSGDGATEDSSGDGIVRPSPEKSGLKKRGERIGRQSERREKRGERMERRGERREKRGENIQRRSRR